MTAFEVRRRPRHNRDELINCAEGCITSYGSRSEAELVAVFLDSHSVYVCRGCAARYRRAWADASDDWANEAMVEQKAAA